MIKKISDLNHDTKLQINKRTETASAGAKYLWETIENSVWINIKPLQGNSLYIAKQLEPTISVKVSLRFRPDVKIGMRFLEETPEGLLGYILKQSPVNPDMQRIFLECLCQEVKVLE